MKLVLTLTLAFCFSISAFAGGSYTGKVKTVINYTERSGVVMLKVDPTVAVLLNPAACATNPYYQFAFKASTADGLVTLALLMSAFNAQQTMILEGTGTCNNYPGIEDLKLIAPMGY
ncbi:MAG: hypothetical protein AB7E76_04350 [Deferribacterales bacterium]